MDERYEVPIAIALLIAGGIAMYLACLIVAAVGA